MLNYQYLISLLNHSPNLCTVPIESNPKVCSVGVAVYIQTLIYGMLLISRYRLLTNKCIRDFHSSLLLLYILIEAILQT